MEKFDRLENRNDLEEIEAQLISKFVHGLRVSIRDQASLQTFYTLNDNITLAKKIEYQHLRADRHGLLGLMNRSPWPSWTLTST